MEKYKTYCSLFHRFDWSKWVTGIPEELLALLPSAQEYILAQENGKERLLKAVAELPRVFALAVPHEKALRIRDDVGFFQAVRSVLVKGTLGERKTEEKLDHAIRQIVSRPIASKGVEDIFTAAGLKKPDISILSDEFLSEVRAMPQKNLAVELLRKSSKSFAGHLRSRGLPEITMKPYLNDLRQLPGGITDLDVADYRRSLLDRGKKPREPPSDRCRRQ